jgi:hypothetical protein
MGIERGKGDGGIEVSKANADDGESPFIKGDYSGVSAATCIFLAFFTQQTAALQFSTMMVMLLRCMPVRRARSARECGWH